MKKHFISLATLLYFSSNVQAQSFQWAKKMGSTGNDYGLSIIHDAAGNVYSTGVFSLTADFDPGPGTFNLTSSGNYDVFVSKLDAAGNFVWAKCINGASGGDIGHCITVDAAGNVYIGGYFNGTADFDPGPGVFNLTSGGGVDAFALKLDPSGNFIWAKSWGAGLSETVYGLEVDGSGNVYTTGPFGLTTDFDPGVGVFNMTSAGAEDIFVSKLDASGNFVWARQFSGTLNDRAWGLTLDATGDVYSCGVFNGTVDFDPGAAVFNLTSTGLADIYISKLNSAGNFVFAKQIGGTQNDYAYQISVDPFGNIYTTGNFNSTADFDPGPGTFNMTSAGFDDIFISKLDISGNFVWAKRMGAANYDTGYDVTFDGSGNIYSTGYFMGTVDFDPGPATFNLSASGSTEDIYVNKLDASGNFVWAIKMGASGTDMGRGITVSNSGFVHATGIFTNTVDFDPGPATSALTSTGLGDIFIQKLANCSGAPTISTTITGPLNLCTGSSAQTYSVATVASATSYSWTLPGGWSGTSSTNTISATPGSSGIFSVTASNACGTSSAQTLSVTVHPLPTITVNSGSICNGASFTIVPGGASTYTFSSGPVVSPNVNSSYSVTGTSSAGCISSNTAVSNITVHATPTITANSGTICNGQSFTITPNGASTYTIQGGNAVVSPSTTNSYTLAGTSTAGCVSSNTATSNVTVNPLPSISASSSTNQLCIGSSATLSASGGNSYTWNPGGPGSTLVISPVINTTYTINGTDANGCSNTNTITQQVIACPNGVFEIQGKKSEIKIYPNPSSGIFNVSADAHEIISVYNVLGVLIHTELVTANAGCQLDLSKHPSGIYFIKTANTTRKIIKE